MLKVGSKGLGKGTSLGFKFGVILGLYQFQNWGCGRIASSGKDKIARCVTERMTSDVTQYSDLDCVEKFCLTLSWDMKQLFAFTVLGVLPSRVPTPHSGGISVHRA